MAKWLEIINPSDRCHISGEDVQAAQMAILMIAKGQYALTDEDGKDVLPPLMFGGIEQFLVENGFAPEGTPDDGLNAAVNLWIYQNWERMEKALRTVTYGSRAECESQRLALEMIDDPDKRQEFIAFNEDARRTSLSRIVHACHAYADKLRRNLGTEVDRA